MNIHKRYSTDEKKKILSELAQTKRSSQEFAAACEISTRTLMRWVRRLAKEQPEFIKQLTVQMKKTYEEEKTLMMQAERRNEQLTQEIKSLKKMIEQQKSSLERIWDLD